MPKKVTPEDVARARAALRELDQRHGEYQDDLLAVFRKRLDTIVEKATADITGGIAERLQPGPDGKLKLTAANRRAILGMDTQFRDAMRRYGYDDAVATFVNAFPDQLPLLPQTLGLVSKAMKQPLKMGKLFTGDDEELLVNRSRLTLDSLQQAVAKAGLKAKERALANLNGLRVDELAGMIEKTLSASGAQAATLAATGMAVFYRVATERALARTEADGGPALKYVYDGPDDVLTRPFCQHLKKEMAAGRSWTRAQIDAMDNGQIPDVFITGGGFNCRHQWRIALPDEPAISKRAQEAELPPETPREQAETDRVRSKATREAEAIANKLPADAGFTEKQANLFDQADAYRAKGLKVPRRLSNRLDTLVSQAPLEVRIAALEKRVAQVRAAASVLDEHGPRAAFQNQLRLAAALERDLASARTAEEIGKLQERAAAGETLTKEEATQFTSNSVDRSTFVHQGELPGKLNHEFVPGRAPLGAGLYATISQSIDNQVTQSGQRIVARLLHPLTGQWSEVKAVVDRIAATLPANLTAKERARAIRLALIAKGYDGILATRGDSRILVALDAGTAAKVSSD